MAGTTTSTAEKTMFSSQARQVSKVHKDGSVHTEPSGSDVEAALSVLLSCLDDKTKQACLRPQSVAMHFSGEESDHYADLLKSTLRRFGDAVQSRVAVFHTRHNDLIPFNTLPTELVAEIFVASIPSERDKYYVATESIGTTRLHQLASVSRRWGAVVRTCPRLWTVLGPGPPSEVALKLKKSGSLPLTIKMPILPSAKVLKDFLAIATEHCHRWSFATFRYYHTAGGAVENATEAINHALGRPMPLLERLELIQEATTTQASLELSGLTNSPFLQHLQLRSINIFNLPTATCYTLRTLHILDLYHGGNFVPMLIGILRQCPELRGLKVNSIFDVSQEGILVLTRGPPLHLPNLERLECSKNGENIALQLLGTIRAEKLSQLFIQNNMDEGKDLFTEILHSHGGPSLLSTVLANSGCTSLKMDVSEMDLVVNAEAPHNMGVKLLLGTRLQWLEDIAQLLQEEPLPLNTPQVFLRIEDEGANDDGEEITLAVDILKITRTIANISTLVLNCAPSNVQAFIAALAQANDIDFARQIRGIGHVVLPRIYGDEDEDQWVGLAPVLVALQARYAGSTLRKAGVLLFKIRDGDGWKLDHRTAQWVSDNGESSSDSEDNESASEGDGGDSSV